MVGGWLHMYYIYHEELVESSTGVAFKINRRLSTTV